MRNIFKPFVGSFIALLSATSMLFAGDLSRYFSGQSHENEARTPVNNMREANAYRDTGALPGITPGRYENNQPVGSFQQPANPSGMSFDDKKSAVEAHVFGEDVPNAHGIMFQAQPNGETLISISNRNLTPEEGQSIVNALAANGITSEKDLKKVQEVMASPVVATVHIRATVDSAKNVTVTDVSRTALPKAGSDMNRFEVRAGREGDVPATHEEKANVRDLVYVKNSQGQTEAKIVNREENRNIVTPAGMTDMTKDMNDSVIMPEKSDINIKTPPSPAATAPSRQGTISHVGAAEQRVGPPIAISKPSFSQGEHQSDPIGVRQAFFNYTELKQKVDTGMTNSNNSLSVVSVSINNTDNHSIAASGVQLNSASITLKGVVNVLQSSSRLTPQESQILVKKLSNADAMIDRRDFRPAFAALTQVRDFLTTGNQALLR